MYACIFIPHFPIQALVRNEPDLLDKAVAVVDGTPPVLKVISVNGAAIHAGVELGMAKLKVEHFFDVVVRQRSESQEKSAHAAMLDCANAFSPRVENTADDTVVIDLEGLDRLFGSYHQIAAQIFDQTILVGLKPNVAVASNPDSAIHAARGFDGILVVPRGTERKRLAELPLEVLKCDVEVIETLHRWGIRTFGAFAALPAKEITERLGQAGLQLHKLACGTANRPLNPHQETAQFQEVMELDYTITLLEPLNFILSRMLDQICRRLRIRNRATYEIRVALDQHERVLRLPLPICDPKLLLKLMMLDLESHPPKSGVTKVMVEAVPTRPRTVQNGLFVPLAPEPEKLQLTLARIAHLVGVENVGSPELLDSHRPDAFRIERFGVSDPLSHRLRLAVPLERGTVCWQLQLPVQADCPPFKGDSEPKAMREGVVFRQHTIALRYFRPAREATVQLRDGIPVWIACHGALGAITAASGPWTSSGEWWREDRWAREEWDIAIESGMYRIYRDLASGRWFAQGVYD